MHLKLTTLPIILFLLSVFPVHASNRLDFETVDRLTYSFYLEQQWDSVIVVGKQALHDNIDYYYLRVRLGVAYFEKQEYFPATTHLRKAREFNSADPFVTGYLYRAYVYTNRTAEARILKGSSPEGLSGIEDKEPAVVEKICFEGGYTFSSNASPDNLSTLMGKDNIYGEQDLYGNNLYGNLLMKINVSRRISLTFAYTYLNFSKQKYFQNRYQEDHLEKIADSAWGKNYIYSFPFVTHDTSFAYHVIQQEAYVSAGIQLGGGFRILPALHLFKVGYPLIQSKWDTATVWDTMLYTNFDSTYHTFPFLHTNYSYTRKDTSFYNFLFALMVTKDIGIFNLGLYGSWSNLNGTTQKQAGLTVTYFPLGNLNFYGTTTATGFFQKKEKRLLLSQVLGGKIASWLWAEGNIYYGDFTNSNIFNGSIVYNNSDKIDYMAGANLVFELNKHFYLSLIYKYARKESQQYYSVKSTEPFTTTIKVQNNPYYTNSIIGGITWKL
jgi:hypothetical protein